jgi:hypothetical protein
MIRKLTGSLFAVVISAVLAGSTATTAFAQGSLSGTSSLSTRTTTTRPTTTTRDNPRTDTDTYKSERQALERIRATAFPKLESTYKIIGHATKDYNCIAWSLSITTKWVWPGAGQGDFDTLDGQYGYKRMSKLDFSLQPGVEKVVLYGKKVNGKMEMTHQARQMKDGTWTSKLGEMALIKHATPDSLNGPDYGQPVAVYYRKVS